MVTPFQDAAGSTPLDADEAAALVPTHVTTQADLNAWEQHNILQGREWAQRPTQTKRELLDEGFIRELHRRMFCDTWKWAGKFRSTDKNIGIGWEHIAVQLRNLLDNTRYQRDHTECSPHDLAIRFHHRLVWIHPFPNGNGRVSRLMADLLAARLGRDAFSWGGGADLELVSKVRDEYLQALRRADAGSFESLVAFARS